MKKLICGVGTNDADYKVTKYEKITKKQIWICPFYKTWKNMLVRCYDEKRQKVYPSYKDCKVCPEWLIFSNFKKWMELQDWLGKELDKDLLNKGNKLYSESTCIFLDVRVNLFLLESNSTRGEYPIGVNLYKPSGNFVAKINTGGVGQKHLGYFDTPEEAHKCWLDNKIKLAKEIAKTQSDSRIAEAIVQRYTNYGQ